MGFWGDRLFESDRDLDIAGDIEGDAGIEIPKYWDDPDSPESKAARERLNDGVFKRLFNKYKSQPTVNSQVEIWNTKLYLVILIALAMPLGVSITKNQIEYARAVYKTSGMHAGAIDQFRTALKDYKNEPYSFDSRGLVEVANLDQDQDPAYDPSSKTAPLCAYCGRTREENEDKDLKKCGKCKKERYCDVKCQRGDWRYHRRWCRKAVE